MITTDNFSALLLTLNFELHNKQYRKNFESGAMLIADFDKKELIYPETQGLKIHERQTCNFSASENFVVFECVHRLLEKGYKPEHIELEPKWQVGHGASGGRADILVKDNQDNALLIIECKTAGKELDHAWDKTRLSGGQLFSYAQQQKSVKFICLYASDFKDSTLSIQHYIITVSDIQNEIEKDINKEIKRLFYKDAQDVKQLYQVWKETYALDYQQNGIFESDVQAYNIGKQKLRLKDLKAITAGEMKGKYNEFAEILRTYAASGKEGAFDKLINLFLCKIVDEKQSHVTGKELDFYWKGEYFDDYFSLIDRLQKLYKEGMEQFLGEKITYIDNQKVIAGFSYFKQDKNATQDYILSLFKEQKYFTNSDFGFIDVHNDKLFYQNAVILLDVVRMWQHYRLSSEHQNQFLGDMFEFFLDKGFKQSEGQFFTPIPICKFILQSLPLADVIKTNPKPPRVIDYACGSGHFLTEYASQIKPFIHSENELKKYYQSVFGVEKEYRLSKVAKISAFMYGQDEINVIYCDSLNDIAQEIGGKVVLVEEETFDILVANPPFAVDGFLTTLPQDKRADYTLFNKDMDIKTQNNIQCFFIERAAQLLAPNGIAAIIVPSSVLSNTDATHVGSREILLKYFDIVALVELGSGTFGKTGTNTVVLFLRRKHRRPIESEQYFNRVNDWFYHWQEELSSEGGAYQDIGFVRNYCKHINIAFEHYETLLKGNPSADLLAHEMFVDYKNHFDKSNEIAKLKEQKAFKAKSELEKQSELDKRFLSYLQVIEKDKLYYFILAFTNPQKVLVIKSPADNKEQKAFLGYSWSDRRGAEGIQLVTGSEGNHLTHLYDITNRDNSEKINFLIAQNFLNAAVGIPDVLQPYITQVNLVDMLDFSRVSFDKTISLTPKKSLVMETKWTIEKLESLMTIVRGASPRPIDKYLTNDENGINWIKIGDVKEGDKYITQTEEKITPEGAKKSRFVKEGDFILSNSMSSGRPYILKITGCIHDGWLLLSQFNEKLNTEYFYYLLSHYDGVKQQLSDNALGGTVKNLNIDRVKSIQIPIPDKDIQEKIVAECEAIDKEVENSENLIAIEEFNILNIINDKIINANFQSIKIGDLSEMSSGGTPLSSNKDFYNNGGIPWINSGEVGQGEIWKAEKYITELGLKNSSAKIFPAETVLLAMYGATAGKVGVLKIPACTNQAVCAIFPNDKYLPKFLYYQLKGMYDYLLSLRTGSARDNLSQSKIKDIKIKLPPDLETQKTLVAEIETLETKIADAQKIINEAAAKKQAVLKSYL